MTRYIVEAARHNFVLRPQAGTESETLAEAKIWEDRLKTEGYNTRIVATK